MKSTLHRQLEDIFGFGGGMADELANQIVMCHRDQVSLTHIAESVQDHRHSHGHRRLPCLTVSRVTGTVGSVSVSNGSAMSFSQTDARLHFWVRSELWP